MFISSFTCLESFSKKVTYIKFALTFSAAFIGELKTEQLTLVNYLDGISFFIDVITYILLVFIQTIVCTKIYLMAHCKFQARKCCFFNFYHFMIFCCISSILVFLQGCCIRDIGICFPLYNYTFRLIFRGVCSSNFSLQLVPL